MKRIESIWGVLLLLPVPSLSTAQPAAATPPTGQWYDGGPGCASTRPGRAGTITLRIWYCEAGERAADPLTLRYDSKSGGFVHASTGIRLRLLSRTKIRITAPPRMEQAIDGSIYIADNAATYDRQR